LCISFAGAERSSVRYRKQAISWLHRHGTMMRRFAGAEIVSIT
jgi:hypothetical protein